MKKKYMFFTLMLCMISSVNSFAVNLYAKETTSKSTPGAAIFVMAVPKEIIVEDKHMECHKKHINISIKYPQIQGLSDKKFEKIVNHYFKNNSLKLMHILTKEAKKNKVIRPYEMVQHFTVKDKSSEYFIIELFEYVYRGQEVGETSQKYIIIDVSRNKVVMLHQMNSQENDYLNVLMQIITSEWNNLPGSVYIEELLK